MDNNELIKKYYETKSEEDYENLFVNNTRLIKYIILRHVKLPNYTAEELIDEFIDVGYIALTIAIKTFDMERIDTSGFTAYAYSCIRNAICKQIYSQNYKKEISLDKSIKNEESNTISYYFGKDDEKYEKIEEIDMDRYEKELIKILIKSINDPRGQEILEYYYGLNGKEKKTFNEIGKIYGCTSENIRIKFHKSLDTMKRNLNDYLKDNNIEKNEIDLSDFGDKFINDSKRNSSYLNNLLKNYEKEEIYTEINNLNEKNKKIIEMYLGINGYNKYKLKELAKELNMDLSSVSRIINKSFTGIENILKIKKTKSTNNKLKK